MGVTSLIGEQRICPACGYDLRGIDSEHCPECGLSIDRSPTAAASNPWTHRKRNGRITAYVRTVVVVIMRPERIARDIERPVSLRDALLFRLITAVLMFLALVPLLTWLAIAEDFGDLPRALRVPIGSPLGSTLVVFFSLVAWLFCLTACGVASYWFHPRSIPLVQQNRAVAISYYACAPLALLPVTTYALWCALTIRTNRSHMLAWTVSWAIMIESMFVAVLGTWRAAVVMLRRTTHCGTVRCLFLSVGLPLAICGLAIVLFVVVPLCAGYAVVVTLGLFHR
jgi:hypothetical protein